MMDIDCIHNFQKLLEEKGAKEVELDIIRKTSIEQMWLLELDNLYKAYCLYKNNRKVRAMCLKAKIKKKKKNKK